MVVQDKTDLAYVRARFYRLAGGLKYFRTWVVRPTVVDRVGMRHSALYPVR